MKRLSILLTVFILSSSLAVAQSSMCDDLLKDGEKYYKAGNYQKALEHFKNAEKIKCNGASAGIKKCNDAIKAKEAQRDKDKDSDGDGVPDNKDACPNEPGSAAANGCPDRDGDGVPDSKDACPDEVGSADNRGCPLDSDEDGIDDENDLCPFKAGSTSNKGCPENEQFNAESFAMKTALRNDLNRLIKTLENVPIAKISLQGYKYEDAYSISIIQRRVNSVKTYLVDRGIDSDRIITEWENEKSESGKIVEWTVIIPDIDDSGDRDGDGVSDDSDVCPDDVGSVDNQGCPVSEQFDVESYVLKSTLKNELNSVVNKLKNSPDATIALKCYKYESSAAISMILNKRRLDAVKTYLVDNGIDDKRISAESFGNKSASGKIIEWTVTQSDTDNGSDRDGDGIPDKDTESKAIDLTEVHRLIANNMNSNPVSSWEDGDRYKGQTNNGDRSGLGAYYWSDKTVYFGGWAKDGVDGNGVYIASNGNVSNCPDCKFYVGDWKDGNKSGTGTCYDATGKLIYFGKFSDGKPTDAYPTAGNYDIYKFRVIASSNGLYAGETKNDSWHGYGIYLWNDGGMWYGHCKDGSRNGRGIEINMKGTLRIGTWNGDKYTAEAAKVEEKVEADFVPFDIVEIKPKFQGKEASEFHRWISEQLNKKYGGYPPQALENNIQGTVRVSFTVMPDGTLADIEIIKKVAPSLDEAVLEIVKQSPRWTPGSQQGKAVKVNYQVPVVFRLTN